MFDKIFVSLQVKRIVIISNKHGIYELPHELPNDLRLRKFGNIKKISKLQNYSLVLSLAPKLKILLGRKGKSHKQEKLLWAP